jgi:hypothetical protein
MEDQPKSALTQQTPTSSPSGESVQPMPIRSDADELWDAYIPLPEIPDYYPHVLRDPTETLMGQIFEHRSTVNRLADGCLYFVGGLRPSVVAFVECGLPWDKSLTSIAAFFQHRDPIGM